MKQTGKIRLRDVRIGGGAPVSVQSMITRTRRDAKRQATLAQIRALAIEAGLRFRALRRAGCTGRGSAQSDLRRLAYGRVVADIHFDWPACAGIDRSGRGQIRLNPGNIGGADRVHAVCAAAKSAASPDPHRGQLPVRWKKHILEKFGGPDAGSHGRIRADHAGLLGDCGFDDICIPSNPPLCRTPCRPICSRTKKPLTRSTSA